MDHAQFNIHVSDVHIENLQFFQVVSWVYMVIYTRGHKKRCTCIKPYLHI